MTRTNQNFELFSGDSATITITVTTNAGTPLNLTGAVAEWVLAHTDGTVHLLKTTSDGSITVQSALDGRLSIRLFPVETAGLLPGAYRHELEITTADGSVATVTTGDVLLKRSYS